jgi:hypothetical protein
MSNTPQEDNTRLPDRLSICPRLIIQLIASWIPLADQMYFAQCNSAIYLQCNYDELATLTATSEQQAQTGRSLLLDHEVKSLLIAVTRSDYHSAYTILKKNSSLALRKGYVTDLAGRRFTKICAFDYALWANDVGMLELLFHMTQNSMTRYSNIQPVRWRFHGKPKYFTAYEWDLSKLIETYENYLSTCDNLNASVPQDWQTLIKVWLIVGAEQKMMVVHLLRDFLWNNWPRKRPPENLLLLGSPHERYSKAPVLPFSQSETSTFYYQRLVKHPHITEVYNSPTNTLTRVIQNNYVRNEKEALPVLWNKRRKLCNEILKASSPDIYIPQARLAKA